MELKYIFIVTFLVLSVKITYGGYGNWQNNYGNRNTNNGHRYNNNGMKTGGRGMEMGIGLPCDYDINCQLPNTYCYRQQSCQCKKGYQESEDGTECITMVGTLCENDYDCISLDHSECRSSMCLCVSGYVSNKKQTQCLKSSQIHGSCLVNEQCSSSLGPATCISGRCECLTGFHYSQLESVCLENRGLYQTCQNSSQCYIGENYKSRTECSNGHCKCRYGYTSTYDSKCESGASKFQSTILLLVVGILANYCKYI